MDLLTKLFSNDPVYKRIKDALIIAFAINSMWPSLVKGDKEEKGNVEMAILKTALDGVKERLGRVEDKLDRMMSYQRRNGHRDRDVP